MSSRTALLSLLAVWTPLIGAAPGCQSPSSSSASAQAQASAVSADAAEPQQNKTTPAAGKARVRRAVDLTIAPPSVLAEEHVEVLARTDDDLRRASKPFADVVKALPTPEYLKPAAAAPRPAKVTPPLLPGKADEAKKARQAAVELGAQDAPEDPPAAALRAYALGRAAYLEGDRFESVTQLEQAARLDPNSAQIARLLGAVYFAKGDDVRGAQRIAQAVKLQPDDSESLFLLGRFAFQKSRWDEAIVTLSRAMGISGRDADPAVEYLGPYYLGQALLETGYDAAAVEQLTGYLKLPPNFTRTTRLHRELAFLDRQVGLVHTQVGDALARLGRFDEAMRHYAQAAKDEEGLVDAQLLTARRVYALTVLGRTEEAERLVVAQLRTNQPSSRTLKLVGYVAGQSVDRAAFLRLVESVYEQTERPSTLALAVAELLPPERSSKFLADHLAARATDTAVYSRLVASLAQHEPAKLMATVVALIQKHPQSAPVYVAELTKQKTVSTDALLKAVDELPGDAAKSAAAWYVRGHLQESAGRVEPAAEAYDKAFAADPSFITPQMATIDLQIRLRRYDRALELLEKIGNTTDAEFRFARARALLGQTKVDEAMKVTQALLDDEPRNARYRLFQSRLQITKRDFAGAEKTLYSILDFDPANEQAYAALFELYDNDPRPESATQRMRLMKRVQQDMPASRIARLKMAEYYAANRLFDRSEQGLRALLIEHPGDLEILSKLVAVLAKAERWADAEKLLIEQIDKRPDDAVPLVLLEEVAGRLGHTELYFTKKEAFLERQKPSLEKFYELARLYHGWKKPDRAVAALEEAVKIEPKIAKDVRRDMAQLYLAAGKHEQALKQLDLAIAEQPDEAPNFHYMKALIHHELKAEADAEKALLQALKIDPEHAPSNNDLGYLWAEQGKNLERALEMTTKAVAAEPEKGEYLDSLGWAYYKLGRFQEAVEQLEKARTKPTGGDPIILDHLGDALWRLGRENTALSIWQGAMRAAEAMRSKERPELEKVRQSVAEKIRAVQAKQQPVVAPVIESIRREKPAAQ